MLPAKWIFLALTLLGPVLVALAADESAGPDNASPKIFNSNDDLTIELTRIGALKPSLSPFLNESQRQEIHQALLAYSDNLALLNDFLSRPSDDVEAKASKSFDLLRASLDSSCKPSTDSIKPYRSDIAGVMHYVQESDQLFERATHQFSSALLDEDNTKEGRALLTADVEGFCRDYQDKAKFTELKTAYLQALHNAKEKLVADQKTATAMVPRIQKVMDAWSVYRGTLAKAIEESSAQGKVADQLWLIIGVFCIFAIFIFRTVWIFEAPIQLELVASGQVIQFATVMVILIVVCVLGISGVLHENTLGTLLGAIGGYVLSQGVGRAASRAATQAAQQNQSVTRP